MTRIRAGKCLINEVDDDGFVLITMKSDGRQFVVTDNLLNTPDGNTLKVGETVHMVLYDNMEFSLEKDYGV